jgi:hypothetical protein
VFVFRSNLVFFTIALLILEPQVFAKKINAMPQTVLLDYRNAFRYAAAWASFDHDDVTTLSQSAHEFHGTLGSLDF